MRFYNTSDYKEYTHVVAIGENSNGNDSVGDMWLETKVFPKAASIDEIIQWAHKAYIGGKLIITISEPEKHGEAK